MGNLRGSEWIVLLILLVFYFIPTYIAFGRRHPQKVPILFLNLLAGWTVVGWVGALIWSLVVPQPAPAGPQGVQYQVGDVVNGHRFNGQEWIPLDS